MAQPTSAANEPQLPSLSVRPHFTQQTAVKTSAVVFRKKAVPQRRPGGRSSGISIADPQNPNERINVSVHEVLEMLIEMRDSEKLSMSESGKRLKIQTVFVELYLSLDRLTPEVRTLIVAERGYAPALPIWLARKIALIKPELQYDLAIKAVKRTISFEDLDALLEDPAIKAPLPACELPKQPSIEREQERLPAKKHSLAEKHLRRMSQAGEDLIAAAEKYAEEYSNAARMGLNGEQLRRVQVQNKKMRENLAWFKS